MLPITATERLNDFYAAYHIDAPQFAAKTAPGQVLLARVAGDTPLPHAITRVDSANGTITLVAASDKGAQATALSDVSGPFGANAVDGAARVLCVGEGLGVAALLPKLEAYKARDAYVIVVAGYRTRDHVYWHEVLDTLSDELYMVTEDASFGIKGPVHETVRAICQHVPDIERVFAAGTLPMLKACARVTESADLPLIVSLAAVLENSAPGEAIGAFDWSRIELDGHKVDYESLRQKLGLEPAR